MFDSSTFEERAARVYFGFLQSMTIGEAWMRIGYKPDESSGPLWLTISWRFKEDREHICFAERDLLRLASLMEAHQLGIEYGERSMINYKRSFKGGKHSLAKALRTIPFRRKPSYSVASTKTLNR